MGNQNDLKKPKEKLKNQIEGELQPQIEKLKQNKNKINLSPKEIQKMKDENVKKDDIITFFQKKISDITIELETYKNYSVNLLAENNQLKLLCGQYQMIIQAQNYNLNLNNNIINSLNYQLNRLKLANNRNQIFNNMGNNNFNNFSFNNNNFNLNNSFNNNNNFNNSFPGNMINNNNINNSFQGNIINYNNFNNNNNFINDNNFLNLLNENAPNVTIVFHFENGMKCPVQTFKRYRLQVVYNLALVQLNNDNAFDLRSVKFFYNALDITELFLNNEEVKSLQLRMACNIDVLRIRNLK